VQKGAQQASKPDHVDGDNDPSNTNSSVIDQAWCVESVVLGSCGQCENGDHGSKRDGDGQLRRDGQQPDLCVDVVLSSNKRCGAVQQRLQCWAVTVAQIKRGVLQGGFLPAARTRL